MDSLEIILKTSRAAAFASLIRILGNFDLAEEAIQEAVYRAVIDWKKKAIPDKPTAWLVQTARRYAIDILRRQQMAQDIQETISPLQTEDVADRQDKGESLLYQHDDQLRLIFTCCHPALSLDAQVALTLKTIAGLSLEEIARTYLLPVKTLEQRITRAKRKIHEAQIPYQIPRDKQLATRLESVMRVIYLIYTQAYTRFKGRDLLDKQLSEAAIYLAYMLNRLIRGNLEAQGLLALMLLQHARAAARVDRTGLPIPLEEQNRQLWDQQLIAQGTMLVEKCQRQNQVGPYQIQAAISAEHCKAKKAEDIDWQAIVKLYEQLELFVPSPVISLNRAIAIARLRGSDFGLEILDGIKHHPQMENFQYYHSARAALLQENGDFPAAISAYKQALVLCENKAETRYLELKVESLLSI